MTNKTTEDEAEKVAREYADRFGRHEELCDEHAYEAHLAGQSVGYARALEVFEKVVDEFNAQNENDSAAYLVGLIESKLKAKGGV